VVHFIDPLEDGPSPAPRSAPVRRTRIGTREVLSRGSLPARPVVEPWVQVGEQQIFHLTHER